MASKRYDVIVIGGGHAGCEAALASARMGSKTLLITLHKNMLGFMSCNPAIGGIGKGQLVKEIDALGGEMAKATDATGIHFKILNTSKGPAVWSSRAQVDREKYSLYMQDVLSNQKNLTILEGEVSKLITEGNTIKGVEVQPHTKSFGVGLNPNKKNFGVGVVMTPGTFLNGLMHAGMKSSPGGRVEEPKTTGGLSKSLKEAGIKMLRFSTCTSARLDGKTIDFSRMEVQGGDKPPVPFSTSTGKLNLKQMPCYLTYTNKKTHEIIGSNLKSSALFGGKIDGHSARYCPSIEEKIIRFPEHPRHQIFLEPEGTDTDEYYPNGFFTNMADDVQEKFIHSVPGLEKVKINRFGYGIEYDIVDSMQLFPTLETKLVKNLYLAGQINGTTGYEEAAAQGLIAGINASLKVKGKPPLVLDRSTSYIGVLLDDLTTKGTNEPYRMFTSRVEYRLILREDNADLRLRKIGFVVGLVDKKTFEETKEKQKKINEGIEELKKRSTVIKNEKIKLYLFVKRPHTKIEDIKSELPDYPSDVLREMEIEVKYEGYIKRQMREIKSFKNLEKIKIPPDLNYKELEGLSFEVKEKLSQFKPLNLGQASRISGITPVAIAVLMVHLKKYQKSNIKNQKLNIKMDEK